jgi:hypothetical protein
MQLDTNGKQIELSVSFLMTLNVWDWLKNYAPVETAGMENASIQLLLRKITGM